MRALPIPPYPVIDSSVGAEQWSRASASAASPGCLRYPFRRWLSRKAAGSWWGSADDRAKRSVAGRSGEWFPPSAAFQAAAGAIWWRKSFMRLWVAVISRHSERQADLPRRWKRSMRRLNFVSAKTGSIIPWRFR